MLEPCALNDWGLSTVVSRSAFLLPRSQPGVAELITPNFTAVTWSNYPTDLCAVPLKQLRHLKSTLINTFIHVSLMSQKAASLGPFLYLDLWILIKKN